MRTVVTAVLQQTAEQRFGSHLLVSDSPLPVTRLPPGRVGNGWSRWHRCRAHQTDLVLQAHGSW